VYGPNDFSKVNVFKSAADAKAVLVCFHLVEVAQRLIDHIIAKI